MVVKLSKKSKYSEELKRGNSSEKGNKYGSFIFHVYSSYENKILMKAIEYYEHVTKTSPTLLQFDGFQAYDNTNFSINDLNEYIKNNSEIVVEFGLKPIQCELKIKEHDNVFISLRELETPSDLCEKIKCDLIKELINCNDKWYMKRDNLWSIVKEPSYVIIKIINKYITNSIYYYSEKTRNEKNKDKIDSYTSSIEKYMKMKKKIDTPSYYAMMIKHLKTLLSDDLFYQKLDNMPYKLAFKDGIYDIKTMKFSKGFDDNYYLTETIEYEYEEANEEDVKYIHEVIKKICNYNDEHTNYYLSILGYSLLGDAQLEKSLFFFIGQKGNNGKTLILDSLSEDVLQCYA